MKSTRLNYAYSVCFLWSTWIWNFIHALKPIFLLIILLGIRIQLIKLVARVNKTRVFFKCSGNISSLGGPSQHSESTWGSRPQYEGSAWTLFPERSKSAIRGHHGKEDERPVQRGNDQTQGGAGLDLNHCFFLWPFRNVFLGAGEEDSLVSPGPFHSQTNQVWWANGGRQDSPESKTRRGE